MKAARLAFLLGLFLSALLGGAASRAEPVDEKPLIDFIEKNVRTLDRSVDMWHWFNAYGRNPLWSSHFQSDDPATWRHFDYMARLFFQNFCVTDGTPNPPDCAGANIRFGTGNAYGPGLYVLADPVGTASYGYGSYGGWAVLQIRLPVGFRYLNADDYTSFSPEAQTVLQALGCSSGVSIGSLLSVGRYKDSYGSQCVLAIRRILKDEIKLDGISYAYSAASFKDCKPSAESKENHAHAFVLTSSRGIGAADVRIFNAQTTDAIEDRARIETLFYLAQMFGASALKFLPNVPGYPGYKFDSAKQSCSYFTDGKYTCQLMIRICSADHSDCQTIPEPEDLDLTQIQMSAKNAPSNHSVTYSNSLLWPDLEGRPLTGEMSKWIKNHLYGCK